MFYHTRAHTRATCYGSTTIRARIDYLRSNYPWIISGSYLVKGPRDIVSRAILSTATPNAILRHEVLLPSARRIRSG